MNESFTYLVAYDVADDARRAQLAELLFDLGGKRLQESLFSVPMGRADLVRLSTMASPLLAGHDKLGWWRTCSNCPGVVAHTKAAILPPGPTGSHMWIV